MNETIKVCPKCNHELDILYFMGVEPDGYVCSVCHLYYHPETMQPLAHVIGLGDLGQPEKGEADNG